MTKKLSSKTEKFLVGTEKNGEFHVHVTVQEIDEKTGKESPPRATTPAETDLFAELFDDKLVEGVYDVGDMLLDIGEAMSEKSKVSKGKYLLPEFEFSTAEHAAEYTKGVKGSGGSPHLQLEVIDKEGDPGRNPTEKELEIALNLINEGEMLAEGLEVFSAFVYAEPASASASASQATKNVGKFTQEDWGACYELFVPVLEDLEKQPNLNRGMKARLNLLKRVEDKLMAYTEYAAEGYGDETPLTVKEMEALREIVENGGRADLAKAFAEW